MQGAGGTAQRIADIQMNSFKGQLIKFKSALEGVAIVVGEKMLPHLTSFAKRITALASSLGSMNSETAETVVHFIAVAAKLGIVILLMPKIAAAITGLLTVFTSLGGGIAGLVGAAGFAALVFVLSQVAVAFAEAKATGK